MTPPQPCAVFVEQNVTLGAAFQTQKGAIWRAVIDVINRESLQLMPEPAPQGVEVFQQIGLGINGRCVEVIEKHRNAQLSAQLLTNLSDRKVGAVHFTFLNPAVPPQGVSQQTE